MSNWPEGGYTYYGVQTLSHTASQQEPGSMTCWAYSLAAVLGVGWSTMALHTSLDEMIGGQDSGQTRRLVEALNKVAGSQGWGRLREPARWYAPEWSGAKLEENFPQALAITGHFVVALAIGKATGQPDRIRYWDPADAQIHVTTVAAFVGQFEPEFGIARAG